MTRGTAPAYVHVAVCVPGSDHADVQIKRQVHRLRKQYDELRSENKARTLEIQEVNATLASMARVTAADRTDDAFQTRSNIEMVTER